MNLPRHIAIIPDGNRRFARSHKKETFFGHETGASTMEESVNFALEKGVEYLSVWGCSVDNLVKRSQAEVDFLLSVFEKNFQKLLESPKIHEYRARVRVVGAWEKYFPASLQAVVRSLMAATEHYTQHHLTFLMAYSGYDEMLAATQAMQIDLQHNANQVIDRDFIKKHLLTRELPSVDLLIRTGGEPHLSSGFMMWDIGDAELYFTPKLWPEFSREEFKNALEFYNSRERRMGK